MPDTELRHVLSLAAATRDKELGFTVHHVCTSKASQSVLQEALANLVRPHVSRKVLKVRGENK